MKTLRYILNNNGGMAWPILSFFLFAYAWHELELFWKIFISISWCLLFIVSILTPVVNKKDNDDKQIQKNKQRESYKTIIDGIRHVQDVYRGLDQQEPMRQALSSIQDEIEQYETQYLQVSKQ